MNEGAPIRPPLPAIAASGALSLYEAVFRASIEGILVVDQDARYLDVNDAACQILDRTREELLAARVGDFAKHRSDVRRIWEKVSHGSTLRSELSVLRPDGQDCELEFSAVANIQPDRHLIFIRDITQRRTLDEQIRNASKMEAVGRLAGGVAHDFNNLLMVISSYSELILDSLELSDSVTKKVREILKASSRAAGLTRQLLAFSRKQSLEPQRQDLNTITREMAKLLGRVLGEDIEVTLNLADSLGYVYADRGQVEQVLMHLAVNARDVMPEGGRFTISSANAEFDSLFSRLPGSPSPGRYAMLSVEDTGCGMSEEVLAHLFEPFFSTKGMAKAAGLGLAAVYGIVKQSGGYIWVDSEVGKGSRFRMYFPLAAKTLREPERAAPMLSPDQAVLVLVEDEEALRRAAAEFLATRGYKILAAGEGSEALALASGYAGKIDVLITDLVMPGLSGRLLAREFVKLHPETRVMYMSGYSDSAVLEHAAEDSPSAFLHKPFRFDALCSRIREVLGEGPESADSPASRPHPANAEDSLPAEPQDRS